jgi:hypothetical protein
MHSSIYRCFDDLMVHSIRPTPQDLQQALEQDWRRIPQDRVRRLIESMTRGVRAVLQIRSESSHKCSVGFQSDDLNGNGSTVAFWLARKSTVARAVCGRALSC